mmetsp:Transcript_17834/g.57410  ORF Transcript_17834/g.57410 Transcript_17834/m.57410 type:complete len:247 (-) Transcript_17834:167-907(-)
MHASRMRSPCSWQCLPFSGHAPYFAKHASGYAPARTAMSVQVTISKPPSLTACTAPSRKGEAVPYGSRSTTSKRSPAGGRDAYSSAAASPTVDVTLQLCSPPPSRRPLRPKLEAIVWWATGSTSFATTSRSPLTSLAYRIVRNPLADSASSTRRPRRAAGFEADAGREAGASAVAVSEASPAAGAGGSCAAAASGTSASGAPASAGAGALPWRRVRCRSAAGLDGWLAHISENCCSASTERSRFGI